MKLIYYGDPEPLLKLISNEPVELIVLTKKTSIKAWKKILDSKRIKNIAFCKVCITKELEKQLPKNIERLTYVQMIRMFLSEKNTNFLIMPSSEVQLALSRLFIDDMLHIINNLKMMEKKEKEEKKPTQAEKKTAFGTDIGELHCTKKHLDTVEKSYQEVIEKAIRLGIADEWIWRNFKAFREVYTEFLLKVFYPFRLGKIVYQETVEEIIDKFRRVRGDLANWYYDKIPIIYQKHGIKGLLVFDEDYRKIPANLDHANSHLCVFAKNLPRKRNNLPSSSYNITIPASVEKEIEITQDDCLVCDEDRIGFENK